MREIVVLIDGLAILDVKRVTTGHAAFSYQHAVGSFLRHFNRGRDGVRCVLGISGRRFGNPGSGIVGEISSTRDQAWAQTRIATFREAIV